VIQRVVAAEVLDQLDADHPAALGSRRDLRRIHRLMGTRGVLVAALSEVMPLQPRPSPRLLELGAGDGSLMLGVARVLARYGCRARITLLDRRPCVERATILRFAEIGWTAVERVAPVEDWIATGEYERAQRWDVILVNLFLHHLDSATLARLFQAVAARARNFIAYEPRRGPLALAASYLVGALGANAVTRTDAVLSVRAGFAGRELSQLWPASDGAWRLREQRTGLLSHSLLAARDPDA
jgi:hypothetical protein